MIRSRPFICLFHKNVDLTTHTQYIVITGFLISNAVISMKYSYPLVLYAVLQTVNLHLMAAVSHSFVHKCTDVST